MKKLFYAMPIAVFLLVSCASTPKNSVDKAAETSAEAEQNETEIVINDEAAEKNNLEAENETESADIGAINVPLSELENPAEFEEKLNEDYTDDLPELNLPNTEDNSSEFPDMEEADFIEEPLVRDIAEERPPEENAAVSQAASEVPAENTPYTPADNIQAEENTDNNEDMSLPETDAQIYTEEDKTEIENRSMQPDLNNSDENANKLEEDKTSGEENTNKIRPVPSRTMNAKKNQLIEVQYPGRGWIYQGNIDGEGNVDARQKNFVFGGRKLGADNQIFSVRARNPGKYLLHFYKNDALMGTYIDDYLGVNVENEESPLASVIRAPDYAKAVPPAVKITAENANNAKDKAEAVPDTAESPKAESLSANETNTETENTPTEQKPQELIRTALQNTTVEPKQTVISEPDNISQNRNLESSDGYGRSYYINSENSALTNEENSTEAETPDDNSSSVTEIPQTGSVSEEEQAAEELLALAKNQYESKEYEKALETLKRFFANAVLKIDEGLFLQGNILESKSNVRNIKNAIDSYDLIVRDYPASPLWDKANKRSIYLKRFYINIR